MLMVVQLLKLVSRVLSTECRFLMCSISGTSSSQHVVSNPTGFTEITICPVNSGSLCDICRCGKFTFNPDNLAAEGERYPGSITCPTESP